MRELDLDKLVPAECNIDDFGVSDAIAEISVWGLDKLDFGSA